MPRGLRPAVRMRVTQERICACRTRGSGVPAWAALSPSRRKAAAYAFRLLSARRFSWRRWSR